MKITITGQLPGLNEYTNSCRSHWANGAKLKSKTEDFILWQLPKIKIIGAVDIKITWYEPDHKRDYDNVVFAKKFIFDALVKKGVIQNDSRKYISRVSEEIEVDGKNPRIEIELEEVK